MIARQHLSWLPSLAAIGPSLRPETQPLHDAALTTGLAVDTAASALLLHGKMTLPDDDRNILSCCRQVMMSVNSTHAT